VVSRRPPRLLSAISFCVELLIPAKNYKYTEIRKKKFTSLDSIHLKVFHNFFFHFLNSNFENFEFGRLDTDQYHYRSGPVTTGTELVVVGKKKNPDPG
jgi:hypothetical protein